MRPSSPKTVVLTHSTLDLLACLYLRRPDIGITEAVGRVLPAISKVGAADLDRIHDDYDALFCIPGSGRYMPPFESLHRPSRLREVVTRDVARLYAATGFDIQTLDMDPLWRAAAIPDHIGFELAFASLLLRVQIGASREAACAFAGMADHLWRHHLGRWAPGYARRLASQARTPFYRLVGDLTAAVTRCRLDCGAAFGSLDLAA